MIDSIKRFFLRHPLMRVFALILLVAIVGGAGVLIMEQRAEGAEIRNAGQALWWAIVTMTTVGYGDFTPLALPGRVLAVIIMFAGISLMAVLSGTVASQLVARKLRANHPRDLLEQIVDISQYFGVEPKLTKELIDGAANAYFVDLY